MDRLIRERNAKTACYPIDVRRETTPRGEATKMKATVEIKSRRSDRNWINGTVTIDDGSEFVFDAKVYDEPSCFGIETDRFPGGGNISKLGVSRVGDRYSPEVLTYDRGWDEGCEDSPLDTPIGEEKAEAIITAIAEVLEKIVDGNTPWAKRYDNV